MKQFNQYNMLLSKEKYQIRMLYTVLLMHKKHLTKNKYIRETNVPVK